MSRPRPLILNVDDDAAGRYAVARILKQNAFDVMDAETGADGIDAAKAKQPDLILLDIRLPDIDGFEVCRRLRADPGVAGIPILQMSASYLDVSSRVKGLENGADAYLTEPVEPAILVATINSILRLKKAENAVRQTAREWQSTFDAIGDGVAALDSSGALIRANGAFRELPEIGDAIHRAFQQILQTGKRHEQEVTAGERTVLLTVDPVADDHGVLTGAVCVASDITDKKRFETQLRQTARLESIGVLAGGIAHDFNNLLTGILGNAGLLLDNVSANAPDRDLIVEIVKASESAADLTRQILAYSGKARFVTSRIDLSHVALESRAFVKRFIPPKVELVMEMDPALPRMVADPGQIQQLLMNLIINAAESFEGDRTGRVRVSTGCVQLPESFFAPQEEAAAGEYVHLRVEDGGSGMDEATRNRIFDPFFTTKFAGRGLGLSAVHGILKAHKGILRLKSEVGLGTTFDLYFPADDGTEDRRLPTQVSRDSTPTSGSVLVVDDESVVRTFARAALEARGYRVLLAENGKIGVDIFREHRQEIGLVILDLTMPVMNGEEAFERMREIAPDVRVILSSGYSVATAAQRFQGKGLAGFLGKPFTGAQLNEAIGAAMRGEPIREN